MKYYIFFHTITGRDIRMECTGDFDIEAVQDKMTNELVSKPFLHFMQDDKLFIVNMANVAYVTVSKAD